MNDRYDVVVIGAGPAGLACALTLLDLGVRDVLVAEKYIFPRDKCCAGYITQKTVKVYRELGLDPADCGYTYIKDFRLFYGLSPRQYIDNRFLLTSREINRVALDDAFFRLAASRGIEIAENMPLTAHDPDSKTVTLGAEENRTAVRYGSLVFADGTNGFGSRYQKAKRRNLAMQLHFPSDRPDGIEIHFGITGRGYCWVSTSGGITNVGITDEYRKSTDYRALFRKFLRDIGEDPDLSGLYSAFTPIGVRRPVLPGNIYFAGDAMGACDPFTLSGLRNGLECGRKAAESVAKNDPSILRRFAGKLRFKFFFMRLLMKVFYLKPAKLFVFNVGCRCLRGVVRFFFDRFLNKK